ncbi:MAG: hypothetical protein ACE14T_10885 [Syntrophales bacterium]
MKKELLKQMVAFNKTAFDSTFSLLMMLQSQMEEMADLYIRQISDIPEEGKKAVNEWIEVYKRSCRDLQEAVRVNFEKVEDFFSRMK